MCTSSKLHLYIINIFSPFLLHPCVLVVINVLLLKSIWRSRQPTWRPASRSAISSKSTRTGRSWQWTGWAWTSMRTRSPLFWATTEPAKPPPCESHYLSSPVRRHLAQGSCPFTNLTCTQWPPYRGSINSVVSTVTAMLSAEQRVLTQPQHWCLELSHLYLEKCIYCGKIGREVWVDRKWLEGASKGESKCYKTKGWKWDVCSAQTQQEERSEGLWHTSLVSFP